MATLFNDILLKCSLAITSFLRKSIRKIKVNLFNLGNVAAMSLINSFLLVTPWSCISKGKDLKGIIGYFRLWKNFFMRTAIKKGFSMLYKYS